MLSPVMLANARMRLFLVFLPTVSLMLLLAAQWAVGMSWLGILLGCANLVGAVGGGIIAGACLNAYFSRSRFGWNDASALAIGAIYGGSAHAIGMSLTYFISAINSFAAMWLTPTMAAAFGGLLIAGLARLMATSDSRAPGFWQSIVLGAAAGFVGQVAAGYALFSWFG